MAMLFHLYLLNSKSGYGNSIIEHKNYRAVPDSAFNALSGTAPKVLFIHHIFATLLPENKKFKCKEKKNSGNLNPLVRIS